MIVIIKEHKHGSVDLINTNGSAVDVVEKYQRESIHYKVHGTPPAITWKVSESSNIIDAMIESSRL